VTAPRFEDPLTQVIADFIAGIGIPVRHATLPHMTFMPGIEIRRGGLDVDEMRLMAPGDLLHEAGHLAVKASNERGVDRLLATPAEEVATLAWSYAACLHLGLAVEVLFHRLANGDLHDSLIENFAQGRYVGLPLLHLWGMTIEPRQAAAGDPPPFPHMRRWLR
jgi:hypothetical protein